MSAGFQQAHDDAAFGLVVFDGVVGEVEQQLAQSVPVAAHGDFLAGGEFNLNAVRLGENLRVGESFVDQFIKTKRLQFQGDLSRVGLGQQRQAVHDAGEPAQFVQLAGGALALGGRKRIRRATQFPPRRT